MYYSEHKMLRQMQESIDCLEKENRYLKDLLDRAGISYEQTPTENQTRALPDPELIGSLLDMKGNRREVPISGE